MIKTRNSFSTLAVLIRFARMSVLPLLAAVVALTTLQTGAIAADKKNSLQVIRTNTVGATKNVSLGLDKSLVVELPRDVRDVLVANPEIADAIVRTARKIFLIGNQVGQTNIFMFDKAGNTVLSLNLAVERDILPLADLIEKYVPGSDVTVEIVNDNIVLTGSVPNPISARRVSDLAQAFVSGGEATTGQFTQTAVSGQNGGDSAISNPDGQGRQQSQIINLLKIEGEDQVHLKVVVAEIKRSVLKQLGINLQAIRNGVESFDISRQAVAGAVGAFQAGGLNAEFQSVSGNTGFGASVQALERANVLRTLAEPTLTAQSGREATFLAGGEVNLPTSSSIDDNGNVAITTTARTVGVSLSFTPVVQSAERISITLNTEVSAVDPTQSDAGAGGVTFPGVSIRRASSTIELPSGGTMIVGGLLKDDLRRTSSGLPYLKNLPVLGPLFGSSGFTRNETELVIMATPYLVRPTARKNLARPDKNFATPSDTGTFLFNQINRIYGGKTGANGKYHGRVGFIYD
ncbi:MAG: type II and III secretion system protein family protein [Hyphomicrobiales bacterium]